MMIAFQFLCKRALRLSWFLFMLVFGLFIVPDFDLLFGYIRRLQICTGLHLIKSGSLPLYNSVIVWVNGRLEMNLSAGMLIRIW